MRSHRLYFCPSNSYFMCTSIVCICSYHSEWSFSILRNASWARKLNTYNVQWIHAVLHASQTCWCSWMWERSLWNLWHSLSKLGSFQGFMIIRYVKRYWLCILGSCMKLLSLIDLMTVSGHSTESQEHIGAIVVTLPLKCVNMCILFYVYGDTNTHLYALYLDPRLYTWLRFRQVYIETLVGLFNTFVLPFLG